MDDKKVIPIGGVTKLDIPVERVLDAAKSQLESVVLAGWDKDGHLYCASTMADGGELIWLLEAAKHKLFECLKQGEL